MTMTPAARHAAYLASTEQAAATNNTTAVGNALTDYIADVFQRLDGVEVDEAHTRVFSDDSTQEIDVLLWNEMAPGPTGLSFMPNLVFVEAKNWATKVGTAEVSWFRDKVRDGGKVPMQGPFGILVAPQGVTGDNHQRTEARNLILSARHEAKLIVVAPAELAVGAADLRTLLKTRLWDLGAGRAGLPS